jgi:NAD(P)-dependent dehydrogenase (short-subunit alcohol dehydrogenase family)
MTTHDFTGKRVFVTGAASGIGAAAVDLFRARGAVVTATDIIEVDGFVRCDVTDPDSVATAMAIATDAMGGLDVCVNVAGIDIMSPFEGLTVELLQRHFAVNVTGPMLVTQAALPHLRASKGNVVTVASISGLQGGAYNAAYCASKGGVLLLMKSLAMELAGEGIRVNCVCPGGVDTPLRTSVESSVPAQAEWRLFDRMTELMPGLSAPSEIAAAIAYLASDDARSITGASLVIDRGALL